MKSILILLLSLTNIIGDTVAAQGITFQSDTLSWQAILDKAKTENKIVFVDAYTSWCGPCKRMAKDVFTQKSVGDVFNASFINVKMDMENGEGPAVAMRYDVKAYPTYMFITPKGELVHRGLGAMPAEKFIAIGKAAANPETQFFALKKKYESGEKNADFLKTFAFACADAQEDALADDVASAERDRCDHESYALCHCNSVQLRRDERAGCAREGHGPRCATYSQNCNGSRDPDYRKPASRTGAL